MRFRQAQGYREECVRSHLEPYGAPLRPAGLFECRVLMCRMGRSRALRWLIGSSIVVRPPAVQAREHDAVARGDAENIQVVVSPREDVLAGTGVAADDMTGRPG